MNGERTIRRGRMACSGRQAWVWLLAIAVSACGRSDLDPAPLAFVPADTPYVFANSQRPREPGLIDLLESLMGALSVQVGEAASQARAALSAPDVDAQLRRTRPALLDLVEDKLGFQGWQRIGFRRDPLFALYGIGLAPVLRIELADGDALREYFDQLTSVLPIRGLARRAGRSRRGHRRTRVIQATGAGLSVDGRR